MTKMFTSKTDLAREIIDVLGLDNYATRNAVKDSIENNRDLFGRYEEIDEASLDALQRAVWADVTDGSAWPF